MWLALEPERGLAGLAPRNLEPDARPPYSSSEILLLGYFTRQNPHNRFAHEGAIEDLLWSPEPLDVPITRLGATSVSFTYRNAYRFHGVRVEADRLAPFSSETISLTMTFTPFQIPTLPAEGTPILWNALGSSDRLTIDAQPCNPLAVINTAPLWEDAEQCLTSGTCTLPIAPLTPRWE